MCDTLRRKTPIFASYSNIYPAYFIQHIMKHNSTKSTSNALSISESSGATLNKEQKAFNRLVKKIEALRGDSKELNEQLDTCLQYYSNELHPKEKEIALLRAELIKKVFSIYCEKKLINKGDKKILKEFFGQQLTNIMPFMELDDELKEIFREAHGASYDDVRQEEFQEMKDEMKEMFDSMGVKMNFDDFTPDMGEEDIARKMHEFMREMKQKTEDEEAMRKNKKKTKKQLEKEERERQKEELRNTSIGKIYKSLAKAFHPDLERDTEKIAEKEELMKRLTVAYESNDLHTLLSLEIEWIKKEEGDIARLSADKLRLYNQILKEQVEELELEMQMLINHPRYQPLKSYFPPFMSPFSWNEAKLKSTLKDYKQIIKEMNATIKGFARNPLKEVREIIEAFYEFNNQKQESENLQELLDMLLKQR